MTIESIGGARPWPCLYINLHYIFVVFLVSCQVQTRHVHVCGDSGQYHRQCVNGKCEAELTLVVHHTCPIDNELLPVIELYHIAGLEMIVLYV